MLANRDVVLGVSGSIAAFKAADLCSRLVQEGASVDVVMTDAARAFITPLTFRSLTGRPVFTNMFEPVTDLREEHVELARRADIVIVAPASASTLARIAHGLADDLLSLTVLATRAPVLVAPAMDGQMWEAQATQANVAALKARGVAFAGPDAGRLASGRSGTGRLLEPAAIVGAAKWLLGRGGDLAGCRIVVSAGGTREPIDPVRYIGNHSSGKMGYAIAEAARDRGADVTLVSAASLPAFYGVELVLVASVEEMRAAVLAASGSADALIMAAAVSDFRPAGRGEQKIKKGEGSLVLELEEIPSILRDAPDAIVKVGFAAETQDLLANARRKPLSHGRLDLICANDLTAPGAGFGADTNRVTLLDAEGGVEELPLLSKYEVGQRILDRVLPLIHKRRA